MSSQRSNVFVFFTDQQRWDSCGCYGQRLPVTPNLDQMAADGVRFENTFTCQPVCGPTRAAIQTGVYPTTIGCHVNDLMLPIDADTVAKRMRAAGYYCGYIGKWHLASQGPPGGPDRFRNRAVPLDRRGGWDDYWLASDALEATSGSYGGHLWDTDGNRCELDKETYRVDAMTDKVMEHIDGLPTDRPFCSFVSYLEPHHQNNSMRFEGPIGSKEAWKDYDVPGDLADTWGDWRENYADYLGCCNALDKALGRVLAKLKERSLLDNTIVIFTSDHACHFWTRNWEYKRSCHDNSIRIPLVVRGPGFEGGHVVKAIASNLDLPGTMLQAAGLKVPEHYQGAALQDILAGTMARSALLVQISESHCGRCIRTTRWTYSVRAPGWDGHMPNSDIYYEEFLYDNEADPPQRTNLVEDDSFAEIRAALRESLISSMQAAGEKAPVIMQAAANRYFFSVGGFLTGNLVGRVLAVTTSLRADCRTAGR